MVHMQPQFGDAASAVRIDPRRLGPDGLVQIWDIENECYIRRVPIDAKEDIHSGRCAHYKPGDEPDSVRFGKSETPTVSAKPAAMAQALAGAGYEFGIHTVKELRQLAYAAGISHPKTMKRQELIAALEKSGYVPGAQEPVEAASQEE